MTPQCGQGCKEGNTENGILFKGLLEAPAEGSDFSLIVGRQFMALTESDIFWNASDTGWVKAAWTLFCTWQNGSCIFVHELPKVEAKVILNVRVLPDISDGWGVNERSGIQVLSLREKRSTRLLRPPKPHPGTSKTFHPSFWFRLSPGSRSPPTAPSPRSTGCLYRRI